MFSASQGANRTRRDAGLIVIRSLKDDHHLAARVSEWLRGTWIFPMSNITIFETILRRIHRSHDEQALQRHGFEALRFVGTGNARVRGNFPVLARFANMPRRSGRYNHVPYLRGTGNYRW